MMMVGPFQLKIFYGFNMLSLYSTLLVTRNTDKVQGDEYLFIYFLSVLPGVSVFFN